MSDDLVKRMRNCVDCYCGGCKYESLMEAGNFVKCMNALINEAADAIEELTAIANSYQRSMEAWADEAANAVEEQSAGNERKRGTWVGIDDYPHESWECDQCGCVVENSDDPWNYWCFCPNCGADMRESDKGGIEWI